MTSKNPYVGPRAFREGESLPNRTREAGELTGLLMAERFVLLHAPSGSGKTSLVQTSVKTLLSENKFGSSQALRVEFPKPEGLELRNKYSFALALDLLGSRYGPAKLAPRSLAAVLRCATGSGGRRVLIIDQLEEVLTRDPNDLDAKEEFFDELGAALERLELWALFVIREDYLGALDRYLRYLPGELRVRYRLDFLDREDALDAVRKPASTSGVEFTDEAATLLVDRLAGETCVEPYQLQVVCRQLWKNRRKAPRRPIIDVSDVEEVNIDRALGDYYDQSVREVARPLGVAERAVRDWVERRLIADNRLRTQTTQGPVAGTAGRQVLRELENCYLIRSDTRGGTTWYELSHDRLVPAALEANRAWQLQNLDSWQVAAYEWERSGRQRSFLLPETKLVYAQMPKAKDLLDHEREFLDQSAKEAGYLWRARLDRYKLGIVTTIAVAELVVLVFVLLAIGR